MIRIRPGDSTQGAETVRVRSDNGRQTRTIQGLGVIRKYTPGPFFIISEAQQSGKERESKQRGPIAAGKRRTPATTRKADAMRRAGEKTKK